VTLTSAELPRIAIAGLKGDAGKSLVALGLARGLRRRGLRVAPYKKGPDFIDAAWLGVAAGRTCYNLDTCLMPDAAVRASIGRAADTATTDIALIEGNRGLFDGMDAAGTHSTAALAKLTATPVILVIDATKVTRTVAALVLGCQTLDPEVELVGVILNRVGTARQAGVIREALATATGLPVLGTIPKLRAQHLPSRHLGLVTAGEHPETQGALDAVADIVQEHVDVERILGFARAAAPLPAFEPGLFPDAEPHTRARIGVLRDEAFSFYYPENLDALTAAGAELVEISPLNDRELPLIDGLYAGGGFPEEHAARLAENEPLRAALAERIAEGIPVWAECGGLMYLSRTVRIDDNSYPMVGALPVSIEQTARPQGHGYVRARVDADNPILPRGVAFCGHEFHYSKIERDAEAALGVPDWAPGLVRAAEQGCR